MVGQKNWNYQQDFFLKRQQDRDIPAIMRIIPGETDISLEWKATQETSQVLFSLRGRSEWQCVKATGHTAVITGLEENQDYEVYVQTDDKKSVVRLARTGTVPGIPVNYLHPDDPVYLFSGNYLCSPSILKLPDGRYLASMDVFKAGYPQNLTILFESADKGLTWNYLSELFPCFWGKLFFHKNAVYMLSCSTEYGDLLIGKSLDGGKTWGCPSVIARGSCSSREDGFHKAPVPVVAAHSRLWSAVEYGCWAKGHYLNMLVSADENADLLNPDNWTITGPAEKNPIIENPCAIEGNVVIAPNGMIVNILRYNPNQALILKADAMHPEKPLEFYKLIDFPLSHTKFEIHCKNEVYYAAGNQYPMRNILSVYTSTDLENWVWKTDVVNCKDMNPELAAFQYPAFTFDGDDMILVSRTAYNGAANYHDNNYQTFHCIRIS